MALTLLRRLRSRLPRRRRRVPKIEGFRYNEILCGDEDVALAIRRLNWQHGFPAKTWDLLKAVHYIQESLPDRSARILDAGCADSPVLGILRDMGYRRLFGCDLTDAGIPSIPELEFCRADLMHMPFAAERFDVVTCISVVEHGVSASAFFREMARVLSPGGHLLLSTDYREPKLTTDDVDPATTFGLPWTIFSRAELEAFLRAGDAEGLSPVEEMRWESAGTPVFWNGKRYTFAFVALRKRADPQARA